MDNNSSFDDIFNAKPSDSEAHNTVDHNVVEETPQVTETTEEPTETAQETEQATEQAPKQARDEKGRFAPKEQTEHVPLPALLAERQRAQAERQRAAQLEAQLQAIQAQQHRRPDPIDDVDGMYAEVERLALAKAEQVIAERENRAKFMNFHSSFERAAQTHGVEAAQAAINFAAEVARDNEQWGQAALSQPDPIGWIIAQQNSHAQMQAMMQDPDGWALRRAAELSATGGHNSAPNNSTQMAAKVQAPRSLASQGSGSIAKPTATTTGDAFDAIFNRNR